MRHKWLKLAFMGSLFVAEVASAVYCSSPFGNGFINQGDSMNMVQSVFGQPTTSQAQKIQAPGFQTTQYWMYQNANSTQTNPLGLYPPKVTVTQTGPVLVFQIGTEGRVTAITENGKNVSTTRGCQGGTIKVGAPADAVTAACGQPSDMSMDNSNNANTQQDVTVWTYNNGSSGSITIQFDSLGKVILITGCAS